MDDTVKHDYFDTIADRIQQTEMRDWVERISKACPQLETFFVNFAGQRRKRFHYGAAHPILTDIERAYIAAKGRDWLQHEAEARTKLVLGDVSGGLDWLDPRELWQVLSAVVIVGGTIMGAFVLSYFTPTVGLGCRLGGYTVFGIVAFGLLIFEMICWWVFDASKPRLEAVGRRLTSSRHPSTVKLLAWYARQRHAFDTESSKVMLVCRSFLQNQLMKSTSPTTASKAGRQLKALWMSWQDKTAPQRMDRLFFKPVECFNLIWLFYITLSQTTGACNNCKCKSSTWGGGGGYIDWNNYNTATSEYVRTNWTVATVLSATIMAIALLYIVTEWCLQSHLSTADMSDAARGLYLTRRFRWLTSPFRDSVHHAIEAGYAVRNSIWLFRTRDQIPETSPGKGQSRRSVRWTKRIISPRAPEHAQFNPDIPMADLTPGRPRASSDAPLIERRDSSASPRSVPDTGALNSSMIAESTSQR